MAKCAAINEIPEMKKPCCYKEWLLLPLCELRLLFLQPIRIIKKEA